MVTTSLLLQQYHGCTHIIWVTPFKREITYHEATEVRTCTHRQFPEGSVVNITAFHHQFVSLHRWPLWVNQPFPLEDTLYNTSCHAAVPLKNISKKNMLRGRVTLLDIKHSRICILLSTTMNNNLQFMSKNFPKMKSSNPLPARKITAISAGSWHAKFQLGKIRNASHVGA